MMKIGKNTIQEKEKIEPVIKQLGFEMNNTNKLKEYVDSVAIGIGSNTDLNNIKIPHSYILPEKFFIVRRYNCCTTGLDGKIDTDIIGLTFDEEYAKSLQSVFCSYEEVKLLKDDRIK